MRNLKRALSLALASVMLLGMMVVGSSAAFADDAEIVNKEAVEITAGLGLFAGSDGKFNPTGTVTRAQMAAVIAKMFYGADLNADTYKGGNQFSDTAAFEGGWAEGYINLGVEKGWFKGYGDGTFGPGNAVTTAEAVTMLINLLKVDAGEGTWPMTVMAAAEEIDLFDLDIELKPAPATNVALTRDQLAVMVWNALNYSAEGNNVYVVTDANGKETKFNSATDAYFFQSINGGTMSVVAAEDALVTATFGLKSLTGYITANQATGAEFTTVTNFALDKEVDVDLTTGLDMIGHYVTVYFETEYSEKEPGGAYCIYDEAEYVVVAEEIEEDRKAFNAAFGTKEIDVADNDAETDDSYNVTETVASYDYDYANKSAGVGTYVVYEGEFVGFIAPAAKSVVEVQKITTKAGNESIRVSGTTYSNTEDLDKIVEYEGIAVEDIAILVTAQDVVYLTKAGEMNGEITKFAADEDGNDVIVVDGKTYGYASYVELDNGDFDFNIVYKFYMDGDKIIAAEELEGTVDMSNIVYVIGTYTTKTVDAYGNDIVSAYAQVVDMEGKESAILIGIEYSNAAMTDLGAAITGAGTELDPYVVDFDATGFQVFKEDKSTSDTKKAGIMMIDEDVIADAPEADKVTLFADTLTDTEFDSKTTKVTADTAGLTFLSDNTKFILVNGAEGKALEVSVQTGLVKLPEGDYDILSTSDKAGNVTLEVVVFVEDEMELPSDEVIYVSAAQIAGQSTTANGTEVEVYFLADNEYKTITVADAFANDEAGFYTYTYDAAEDLYDDLTPYSTGIKAAETLKGLYGGNKLITLGYFDGQDASEAVIIDTRAAKDIEKSDFAEVEDLKDLADLIDADIHVIMDVIIDTDDINEPVTYIFVLEIAEHDFDLTDNMDGTHDAACDCGVELTAVECEFVEGECACGAQE